MASDRNSEKYQSEDFPLSCLQIRVLWDIEGEDSCIPGEEALGRFYMPRFMRFFHDCFASGKYGGSSLMDMCCGPTIHCVMSAGKYYDNIHMTEYAAANRRAVEMWRSEDPAFTFDWSRHFELVAQLEGCSPKEVEGRLRRRMRGVYPCDLTEERPLGDFSPPPLDCLISSLTIIVIAKTPDSYREVLKKMVAFIKPGGVLILSEILGSQYYMVDGVKYEDYCVEEGFLKRSLIDTGMEVEKYAKYPVPNSDMANPGRSYIFLVAKKRS